MPISREYHQNILHCDTFLTNSFLSSKRPNHFSKLPKYFFQTDQIFWQISMEWDSKFHIFPLLVINGIQKLFFIKSFECLVNWRWPLRQTKSTFSTLIKRAHNVIPSTTLQSRWLMKGMDRPNFTFNIAFIFSDGTSLLSQRKSNQCCDHKVYKNFDQQSEVPDFLCSGKQHLSISSEMWISTNITNTWHPISIQQIYLIKSLDDYCKGYALIS